MGLDIFEVINAVQTFGFTPYYPRPGLVVIAFPSIPFTESETLED